MKTLFTIISLSLFMACGKKVPPLSNTFPDISSLAEHHLGCIERNLPACLDGRMLTYREFIASVYPYLPEGKDPMANIAPDVYWGWILPDRQKGLKKLFERFGGMRLIRFNLGEPKKILKLDGIRLYRDIPIQAEFFEQKTNKTHLLASAEILKAVVEINGEFKLWNINYE